MPRFNKCVDVGIGELADVRLKGSHPPRCEGTGDQAAQSPVVRGVHAQKGHHRPGFEDITLQRNPVGIREAHRVPESGQNIGMTRKRPEITLLAVVDRCLLAQARIGRVRIFVDLPVVGIKIDQGDGLQ